MSRDLITASMPMPEKVAPHHLDRLAVVYVRQSTLPTLPRCASRAAKLAKRWPATAFLLT
jgi:hypothetical protein